MIELSWSEEKNELVKDKTGISFEDVSKAILRGNFLDDIDHPNKEKYAHQRILIVKIDNYAYSVPYVIQENGKLFLKTLYPNRIYKKKYLK